MDVTNQYDSKDDFVESHRDCDGYLIKVAKGWPLAKAFGVKCGRCDEEYFPEV